MKRHPKYLRILKNADPDLKRLWQGIECGILIDGLYSEINDPQIPQYHSAKSVLQLLERLTYQKFGGFEELDIMADAVDDEIRKRTKSNRSWD